MLAGVLVKLLTRTRLIVKQEGAGHESVGSRPSGRSRGRSKLHCGGWREQSRARGGVGPWHPRISLARSASMAQGMKADGTSCDVVLHC
jgi:hypothetical protein